MKNIKLDEILLLAKNEITVKSVFNQPFSKGLIGFKIHLLLLNLKSVQPSYRMVLHITKDLKGSF